MATPKIRSLREGDKGQKAIQMMADRVLMRRPDDDDMAFAMAAGAIATTHQGAIPALPDRETIWSFLADRSGNR